MADREASNARGLFLMSNIPQEYLSGFDFGFNAVEEIPQTQVDTTPSTEDVDGINDNINRIENKIDSVAKAISQLTSRMTELDDEFDFVKANTEQEVKDKLTQVEKLMMPLLVNLLKTADKDYIHWPNRKETVQEQIDKLLLYTRGG